MKVSELEGPLLDYWVARAISVIVRPGLPRAMSYDVPFDIGPPDSDHGDHFEPSVRWGHGGPLMEKYAIMSCHDNPEGTRWFADVGGYMSHDYVSGPRLHYSGYGPTPLIAAMRALVSSRFGEEVDDAKAN